MIRAVVFDVGETLVDETRMWSLWAEWLKVPHATFLAALGSTIARGEHHRRVFEVLVPGLDLAAAVRDRAAAGAAYAIQPGDFYPDALPCLAALREHGVRVGIAGNQPDGAEAALAACGVSADFIASSARWQIEKPSPRFFEKVVHEAGLPPDEIAYVGDRLDNDILPAAAAGLFTVFLERGPWGKLHARWPDAARADLRVRSLAELPALLTPQFTRRSLPSQ